MFFLGLALFFVLSSLLIFYLRQFMRTRRRLLESQLEALLSNEKESIAKKEEIEKKISVLNLTLTKTVKMYEAARDICVSLDEEKLFLKFKEDLKKLIDYRDCLLLPEEDFDAQKYPQSAIVLLKVQEIHLGYLVIGGVGLDHFPFLNILIGQFALGLKRAKLYRMIQELAITDSLTGLFTRRYVTERLGEEFDRAKAHDLPLSFLMIDADDFKECNDKFGHLVGDIVLSGIANRIRENIREVDMAGRFGGEEFMVIAPNTSKETAFLIAERIRKSIEAGPICAYDEKVNVTVSIGLSSYPQEAKSIHDLVGKADWALYQAKKIGKNKSCCFGVFHE